MTLKDVFTSARACLVGVLLLLSPVSVSAQSDQVGQWTTLTTLPFFPVHAHLLPSGKVMIWPGDAGISGNDPRLWDPADQTVTTLAQPGYDLFCSGHAFLADGRLFVAGGHIQNNVGLPKASLYDPVSNTWAAAPDMNAGRWYPTVTTLANGDALVVSGDIDNTVGVNPLPQVYQAGTGTWRSLTSAQLSQDLYPMMFLAPNGEVVNVAPTQTTRYLDTWGTGSWSLIANRNFGARDYGSAVLYADGKILVVGGGDPPTNTAEVIDLNQPSPTWRFVAPMSIARRQLNATLLPDGTVLVTGGTSGPGFDNATTPVYPAELWNPATETWTTLASATVPRLYHSAAVLLPDGRVLSTGGNDYPTPEAFSPPYLFKGARPTLSAVPSTIGYGQHFSVQSPDAASVTKVTLIRLTSVTHAFNANQRLSVLSFTPGSGALDIVAPANANIAPPGHYLLFIVDGSGVPSVGSIVQLPASTPAPLSVAPTSLSFAKTAGQPNPPAQTVTVTAVAGQVWSTHDSMSFANVTGQPYNGSDGVIGTEPGTFHVVPSSGMTTLAVGVYNKSITVSGGAADVVIPVQVTVSSPPTALSVSPTTVTAEGSVTATWSGIASPTATDWIGLYAQGTADTAYRAWIYVSCSKTAGSAAAAGSCAFPIPGTVAGGTYELRLFSKNGFTKLANSNALAVNSLGLSMSPTTLVAGGSGTATWSGIASPTATDWIGLYALGAADTAYLTWIYVSCSKTAGSAAAGGACAFPIPGTVAGGTYQLRLFSNNGFTKLATSNTLTVTAGLSVSPTTVTAGGSVTATWSGIASPTTTDWIGLYASGAADTAYVPQAWIYVSCSKTAGSAAAGGACAFPIPGTVTGGTYQLRLFSKNGFTKLATSNALTVH